METQAISPISRTAGQARAARALLPVFCAKAACAAVSLALRLVRSHFQLWRLCARHYPEALSRLAALMAYLNCRLATATVPAYQRFLAAQRVPADTAALSEFPETTRENYAGVYTLESQCRQGRWDLPGSTVDESSGSTGQPFNWLRCAAELEDIHRNIGNYIRLEFPTERLFCINAFSMGAWATGVNFTAAMRRVAMVKSAGPDVPTIIATLRAFGPKYDYLITAYPPFLKHLCDELETSGLPLSDYRLYGLVAGEAMTEALRSHLQKRFIKVLSGYGASDVQVGIGGETDFTVALRQRIAADARLRYAILGEGEDRIPMIFQYNPCESYIEVNTRDELIFTLGNTSVCCPKLRYNLHDEGMVRSFGEIAATLARCGAAAGGAATAMPRASMRMPLLFLFGRRDSTVSVMGANIYPQDIEHGLYRNPQLAQRIHGFVLALEEHSDLSGSVTVHVEWRDQPSAASSAAIAAELEAGVCTYLQASNRDFANAARELSQATRIRVNLHKMGTGPFAARRASIKNRYLLRAAPATV